MAKSKIRGWIDSDLGEEVDRGLQCPRGVGPGRQRKIDMKKLAIDKGLPTL